MGVMVDGVGRLIARYLEKPAQGFEPYTPSDPQAVRPGDMGDRAYLRHG
jgi:hypothetical protein